jgi:hypothetical protein
MAERYWQFLPTAVNCAGCGIYQVTEFFVQRIKYEIKSLYMSVRGKLIGSVIPNFFLFIGRRKPGQLLHWTVSIRRKPFYISIYNTEASQGFPVILRFVNFFKFSRVTLFRISESNRNFFSQF